MNTVRIVALMTCSAILTGCQPPFGTVQPAGSSAGKCDASPIQTLIGEQASPALFDQARRKSKAAIARIVRRGGIVTLEYNA